MGTRATLRNSYLYNMKKILFAFSTLILFSLSTHGQSWLWAKQATPGSKSSFGEPLGDHTIQLDKSGNIYSVGYFVDTLIFGYDTLKTRRYRLIDAYLVKYSSNGNAIWAKQSLGYSETEGNSLAVDKMNNSYITGTFYDTTLFGPYILPGLSTNVFIAKYDSNGSLLWAHSGENTPEAWGNSVAVDDSGNTFITGWFLDSVSFGIFTLKSNIIQMFLVKYNPSGGVVWAKQTTKATSNGGAEGNTVIADHNGNIYIAGNFGDTVIFSGDTLYNPEQDIFLTKYDRNGNVKWVKKGRSPKGNSLATPYCLAYGGDNDIYLTGYFQDTLLIGSNKLIAYPYTEAFVAKFDTDGQNIWAKQTYSLIHNYYWVGSSIACDTLIKGGANLVLVEAGPSPHKVIFSADTFELNNSFNSATLLLRIDSSGQVLCRTVFDEGNEDDGDGIITNKSGTLVYIAGDIDDTTIFGPDTLVYGNDVTFLAQWQPCNDTLIVTSAPPTIQPSITLYPNPSNGIFTILTVGVQNFVPATIEIYNMMGEQIKSEELKVKSEEINLSNEPNGVYFYRVLKEDGGLIGEGKIIIQH